jgi:hypothetical protein
MSANVQARSPSALPVRKVTAAGAAGAATAIIVWILSAAFKINIPPEIASAITVVLAVAAGYLVPPSANDVVLSPAPADPVLTGAPR